MIEKKCLFLQVHLSETNNNETPTSGITNNRVKWQAEAYRAAAAAVQAERTEARKRLLPIPPKRWLQF